MRLMDADALVDVLMTYTWRDEDERLIDDADEKREYIKQWLPDLPTVSGWVSVKDRMPENEEIVIGYTPCDGHMFVGFYRTYKFDTYEWSEWNIITSMRSTKKITKKVTHWMPLPPEPEVSK